MPSSLPTPLRSRVLALVVALGCTLALGAGAPARAQDAPASPQEDPAVIEARQRAEELDAQAGRLTARLDEAAVAYEAAQAHAVRVGEAGAGSQQQVEDAVAVQESARAAIRRRVREAYKSPDGPLAATSAVVDARDAAHALHRIELLREVDQRGAADVARTQRWADLQLDETSSLEVVAAGSSAAAERQRLTAEALTTELSDAESDLRTARANVTVAVADAERRIEEERRRRAEEARLAAEAAAAARAAGEVAAPLPALGGRYCPVGTPNAFSDTWGAPRSGGRTHEGVDIFSATGTPNYAVEDGVIRVTNGGLGGLAVHLSGDSGDRYYYAHLSAVDVTSGQRVQAGQLVGRSGQSGNARTTPPHTHFQYRPRGGLTMNPTPLTTALCR